MERKVYITVALVSAFCFGTLGTMWSGSVSVATDTVRTKVYFNEYHKEPETKSKAISLLSLKDVNEAALIKRSLAEIKAARHANQEFEVERVVCTYSDNNNKEIAITHRSGSKALYVVHKEGGNRISEKSVVIATI